MVTSEGPQAGRLELLVAISLLGLGTDTTAARLFREDFPPTGFDFDARGRGLVEGLAGRLWVDPARRAERLAQARERARRALAARGSAGCSLITALDAGYPPALLQIPDPPVVLWVRGIAATLGEPAVALVGSRRATPTGLAVARRLSQELAEAGLCIVSGLARGIDGAAHRGALDAGGKTVAVLGNGVDVAYPAEHRALATAVAQSGAVVSEFPPGTRPQPNHFPLRNRIISGLSGAVVVVEASERSGSLITARAALEQGRDVLAVPGNVAAGTHRGCHALIKDGARLVETVEDILDELGRPLPRRNGPAVSDNTLVSNVLEEFMPSGERVTADELAARSGRKVGEWLADLALLEVAGLVARTPGGGFVRLDGPATYIGTQPERHRKGTGSIHGESARRRRVAGQGEDD
jgi:DNA processing protein